MVYVRLWPQRQKGQVVAPLYKTMHMSACCSMLQCRSSSPACELAAVHAGCVLPPGGSSLAHSSPGSEAVSDQRGCRLLASPQACMSHSMWRLGCDNCEGSWADGEPCQVSSMLQAQGVWSDCPPEVAVFTALRDVILGETLRFCRSGMQPLTGHAACLCKTCSSRQQRRSPIHHYLSPASQAPVLLTEHVSRLLNEAAPLSAQAGQLPLAMRTIWRLLLVICDPSLRRVASTSSMLTCTAWTPAAILSCRR